MFLAIKRIPMCEIIHENASMRMLQIYSYFKVGPRFVYFVSFVLFFLGGGGIENLLGENKVY